MSILNKKILSKRKGYLEDLIFDIEKDIKEANRLKAIYQKTLEKINKDIENIKK